MLKDRDQKHRALRFAVAKRWLPQLEVDVVPPSSVSKKSILVTDMDVYASAPDLFKGFRTVIFDCKTKRGESAVNRCLWLSGLMNRVKADHGYCILNKNSIEHDHRLFATSIGVVLLEDQEFDVYAGAMAQEYDSINAAMCSIRLWEDIYGSFKSFPSLAEATEFLRSSYWMLDDPSEACRRSLTILRSVHTELDPKKPSHCAFFFEFCTIFSRSLAMVVTNIFNSYLQPEKQNDLAEALLVNLYGGRDAYEHRNSLFRWANAQQKKDREIDLVLPEWTRFVQLARQMLDSPEQAQMVPLILRETGFNSFLKSGSSPFVKRLLSESPHGGKFSLLVSGYLCRAAKLPPEFAQIADDSILRELNAS